MDKSSGYIYVDDTTHICKTNFPFDDKVSNPFLNFFVKKWNKIFWDFKLDENGQNKIHEILEKRKEEIDKMKKKICEKCGDRILKHHCKNKHKTNDRSAENELKPIKFGKRSQRSPKFPSKLLYFNK